MSDVKDLSPQTTSSEPAKTDSSPSYDELKARLDELEKRFLSNPVPQSQSASTNLAEQPKIEEVHAVFEDAYQKTNAQSNYDIRRLSREQQIIEREKQVIQDINTIRRYLDEGNYPHMLFSDNVTNETAEKCRRALFHFHRLGGEEFVKRYKEFVQTTPRTNFW